MSIGNLKTQGGKGTNYPFQLKVLQGLQCACDQLKAIGADTTAIEATLLDIETAIGNLATEATLQSVEGILQNVETNTTGLATETTLLSVDTNSGTIVTNTTGVARTPGIIRPLNTSGNVNSVAATFYSVSVANVGAANGTVLGVTIQPGEVLNFSADALNNFFNSFAYDATGTEFVIIFVY